MTEILKIDRKLFSGKLFSSERNLTREEEVSLVRDVQENRDKEACEVLLVCHYRHLTSIAKNALRKLKAPMTGPIRDEADQIAFTAFMEAVGTVDLSKGRLATHYSSHVYYSVLRKISESRQPFRMLTNLSEKKAYAAVRDARRKAARRGADISISDVPEIVRLANVTERQATRTIERHLSCDNDIAIDATPEVLDTAVPDNLIDHGPYDDIDASLDVRLVLDMADRLDPRSRDILLRVTSGEELLETIGLSYQISKERVRQIHKLAVADIKRLLAEKTAAAKPAAGNKSSITRNRTSFTPRLLTIGKKPAPAAQDVPAPSLAALIETALREAHANGNAQALLKELTEALAATAHTLGLSPTPEPVADDRIEIVSNGVNILVDGHYVAIDGKHVPLGGKQYLLFRRLVESAGRIVTRDAIYAAMYDGEAADPKIIDVYVCKLRKKFKEACGKDLIETAFAAGYMLLAGA